MDFALHPAVIIRPGIVQHIHRLRKHRISCSRNLGRAIQYGNILIPWQLQLYIVVTGVVQSRITEPQWTLHMFAEQLQSIGRNTKHDTDHNTQRAFQVIINGTPTSSLTCQQSVNILNCCLHTTPDLQRIGIDSNQTYCSPKLAIRHYPLRHSARTISMALLQVHRIQGIVSHFGQFVKALLGLRSCLSGNSSGLSSGTIFKHNSVTPPPHCAGLTIMSSQYLDNFISK